MNNEQYLYFDLPTVSSEGPCRVSNYVSEWAASALVHVTSSLVEVPAMLEQRHTAGSIFMVWSFGLGNLGLEI